jgi:(E)-4-hydroxy-3-methylbut-2-enyl-diphosphate synthase
MQISCSQSDFKTRGKRLVTSSLVVTNPIRIQTMTDGYNGYHCLPLHKYSVNVRAGAELACSLASGTIKKSEQKSTCYKDACAELGYTPLVADIYTMLQKLPKLSKSKRLNPGNYVDKKKFEQIDYTDAEYAEEIDRIKEDVLPFCCKNRFC